MWIYAKNMRQDLPGTGKNDSYYMNGCLLGINLMIMGNISMMQAYCLILSEPFAVNESSIKNLTSFQKVKKD